jgi:hypothetical protein
MAVYAPGIDLYRRSAANGRSGIGENIGDVPLGVLGVFSGDDSSFIALISFGL